MQTKHIIEGLTILEKYRTKDDGFNTGAEHDEIFAYSPDLPIQESDKDRLKEIGWKETCEDGWSCFV